MSSKAPRAGARLRGAAGRSAGRLAITVAIVAIAAHATGACARRPRDRGPAVRLWLAGDVHLGAEGALTDPDVAAHRLAALVPLVDGAAGIVNLEGPITTSAPREGELFNHPALLPGLARAGVAVVGIANNHAADGGGRCPVATRDALVAHHLVPAGGPAGAALLERGGLRVAVTAHDLPAGGAGLDLAALAAELADARTGADVLIATFHVTGPPSYLPPREALTAVALARTAGAAVIALHGSHALARVERTAGGVTAWGLGNLLFACACTDEDDALVLLVTIDRAGLVDAAVVPVTAGLRGGPAHPAAEPALTYELLRALRSTPLAAAGPRARLLP
jgi:hypothetical protein